MARRRGGDDDVSLFPFLSIIACVIGVLTLLISALALAQMDNEAVASLEQWEKTQRELASIRDEIERLKTQLDQNQLRSRTENAVKFGEQALRIRDLVDRVEGQGEVHGFVHADGLAWAKTAPSTDRGRDFRLCRTPSGIGFRQWKALGAPV